MYFKRAVNVGLSYLVFEIYINNEMLHKVVAVDMWWQNALSFLLTGVLHLRA